MKPFKKIASAVAALAICSGISASAIPAFASETEAMQIASFVEEYSYDEDLSRIVQFYLDSDFSYDEMQMYMEMYLAGREEANQMAISLASENTPAVPFYSEREYSTKQHYAIAFVDNASVDEEAKLTIGFNSDNLIFGNSELFSFRFLNNHLSSDLEISRYSEGNQKILFIDGRFRPKASTNISAAVFDVQFGISANHGYDQNGNFSEKFIRSNITKGIAEVSPIPNTSPLTDISVHTYVLGDINRDGVVTMLDQFIIQNNLAFVTDRYSPNFDEISNNTLSYEVAEYICQLAPDVNRDGVINMNDAALINVTCERWY